MCRGWLGRIVLAAKIFSFVTGYAHAGGALVLAGGKLPLDVLARAVELAGGSRIKAVIVPQGSNDWDRGSNTLRMFRRIGIDHVEIIDTEDTANAQKHLAEAQLIWFSGGKQSRLMKALVTAGLTDLIRRRHNEGTVIGGSSAGAAVASQVMIATSPKKSTLRYRNTPIERGLGLVPGLIIDQHFVARRRISRLLSVVMDHRDQIGVGIGEHTAVVIVDDELTVIGEGHVVVIDPHNAHFEAAEGDAPRAAHDLRLHVLRAGAKYVMP